MQNNIYIIKQVVKHLKVNDRTVIRLIHAKKFKASKVSCSWRILEKDINKYLESYMNYKKEA